MHDYEREAENIPSPPSGSEQLHTLQNQTLTSSRIVGLVSIVQKMCEFTKRGDGAMLSTSMCLEPDAIEACAQHIPVVVPGAGVTPRAWTGDQMEAGPLKMFLDKFGKDEVIYISFGYCAASRESPQLIGLRSMYWPTAHISTLIGVSNLCSTSNVITENRALQTS